MKLLEVLEKTTQFFKDKKLESPRLDAELLLTSALGLKNRVDLYLKFDQPLKDAELNQCRDFVRRRSQGEPVAYITGKKGFYKFDFLVDVGVLVPRPETEILVEEVLLQLQSRQQDKLALLDLGCGTGCIGLSLLKELPQAELTAIDLSPVAISNFQKNIEALKISQKVKPILGDATEAIFESDSFDTIVANPPYIDQNDTNIQESVRMHEPELALFAKENGFQQIRLWAERGVHWLKPGGVLGFEIGFQQGQAAKDLFINLGLTQVKIIKDLAGHDRHVIGIKPLAEERN